MLKRNVYVKHYVPLARPQQIQRRLLLNENITVPSTLMPFVWGIELRADLVMVHNPAHDLFSIGSFLCRVRVVDCCDLRNGAERQ